VTSDPSILAVGECVEHRGACYGLVAPLWDMCHALADGLAETPTGYTGSVTSTKLKVSGSIDCFRQAIFRAAKAPRISCCASAHRGIYKRLVVADDKLIGAVLYGDTARWQLVFPAAQGRHRYCAAARQSDLRPGVRRDRARP
jgi:nitrite reductase (NADH) large subunit